ncbi:HU family DNA-binding protein [Gluconacetobacter diazotrophicus]|uniref:HU family DNA-binding protein n=1 Tax=Gluconacetobacter diazotrophicus TaxID=33996 RepID=A0A7W4NNB4_GLUDI|nr:HU family DNA-binding protein [Gluconacetobacter diazotrophicus]MBB2158368.1 HU family DNA-binding protein [Gluconacetobacter diazotrophicus]
MSKAFIAAVIQDSLGCTGVAASHGAEALIQAIVSELRTEGSFTLPSFGRFTVCTTKTRQALNPRTGEPVKVEAGRTVRFKASPVLKKSV